MTRKTKQLGVLTSLFLNSNYAIKISRRHFSQHEDKHYQLLMSAQQWQAYIYGEPFAVSNEVWVTFLSMGLFHDGSPHFFKKINHLKN